MEEAASRAAVFSLQGSLQLRSNYVITISPRLRTRARGGIIGRFLPRLHFLLAIPFASRLRLLASPRAHRSPRSRGFFRSFPEAFFSAFGRSSGVCRPPPLRRKSLEESRARARSHTGRRLRSQGVPRPDKKPRAFAARYRD